MAVWTDPRLQLLQKFVNMSAASGSLEKFDIRTYLAAESDPLSRPTSDFPDIKPDPDGIRCSHPVLNSFAGSGQGDLSKHQKDIKHAEKEEFEQIRQQLGVVQPALWSSRKHALLVVFQGMDAAGTSLLQQ